MGLFFLLEEKLIENAAKLGDYLIEELKKIKSPLIDEVRGKGLLVGLSINPRYYSARELCLRLMEKGVLSKETHKTVIRLAPPLVVTQKQLDLVIAAIVEVLTEAEAELEHLTRK